VRRRAAPELSCLARTVCAWQTEILAWHQTAGCSHQHGEYAWGRWVGMSYDGPVVSGWGAIARTEDQAHQVVLDLINDSRP
jgi:hypothetical protein